MYQKNFQVVTSNFLPEFENLLQDQVPLPAYSLKLMRACTDKSRDLKQTLIKNTGIFCQLLDLFKMHRSECHSGGSSVLRYTVGILNDLVADKSVDVLFVCRQGFLDEFTSLFVDVVVGVAGNNTTTNYDVSHLLLQLLDIMHHILKKIEQSIKRVLSSAANSNNNNDNKRASEAAESQRTPNSGGGAGDLSKEDIEELLQGANVLSDLNGLLMNLLVSEDADLQEWACRSLYLSAELFGGGGGNNNQQQEAAADQGSCFTPDNLRCLYQATRAAPRKRQKLLVRIVKRFAATNSKCRQLVVTSSPPLSFKELFEELVALKGDDNDTKSVRNVAAELRKLCTWWSRDDSFVFDRTWRINTGFCLRW